MICAELPAQAANVLRAIGSTTTCTSTQVESLRLLLLPAAPTTIKKPIAGKPVQQQSKKSTYPPAKPGNPRAKKPATITIHQCEEEADRHTLGTQARLVLATEVINVTLKALTLAIKASRAPQTPRPKRRSLARSSSSASVASAATPSRCLTPLQPISANTILQSPAKTQHLKRSSSGSFHGSNNIRSQAECARVGLASLRSLQTLEKIQSSFAPLQLETAMSALIAKSLALGYDDLALKELRILRKRIEALACGQSGTDMAGTIDTRRTSREEEKALPNESLHNLLKYTAISLSGPLLALVITSQMQALKILALKSHGPSIDAALEHLRMGVEYAPARLIEKQINSKDQRSKTNAVHQLDTFAQTLLRLCPAASKAVDKSSKSGSGVSPQSAFELQSLAFQIRLRWWDLSEHQPGLEAELIGPLARCLGAFQRRCKNEGSVKYRIARDNCNLITTALDIRNDKGKGGYIDIYKHLADMALESHLNDEAIEWIKRSLKATEPGEGSPSRHCMFLCQLATCHLRESRESLDDTSVLQSLRNAAASLEGDLRGESLELDELLLAVANLRKSASLFIQDHASLFNSITVLDDASCFAQCLKFVLLSIRFLARYLGSEPSQEISDSKHLRYHDRKKMAAQVAPSIIESIVTISRFSVKAEMAVWVNFDAGLRECLELAKVLHMDATTFNGCSGSSSRCSLPFVPISQAFWYRFLALKSLGAEPKLITSPVHSSIRILEGRSSEEKTMGCLLMKLEKCAMLCETLKDYGRATECYEKAIRSNIETGIVQNFAEAARLISWPSAIAKDRDFEQLLRFLQALPKAALKGKGNPPRARTYFDPVSLPSEQRGLILELQLSSITSILLSHGSSSIEKDDLNTLATTVLSLYQNESLSIRRLYVRVRLLHILSVHPDILAESIVSELLDETETQSPQVPGCLDEALRPYAAHLSSCVNAYLEMRGKLSNYQRLETIVSGWCRLLQQFPVQQSLEENVYDITGWLQQLELISRRLNVQGNENLRTAILHLMVSVREGACSTQCLDLASRLTDLGIHYTRLGYSGQGGVILRNAQRYLDSSDVPGQLKVKWFLTKAEFTLLNGSLDKCSEYLGQAREAFQTESHSPRRSLKDRTAFAQSAANMLLVQSRFSIEKGYQEEALFFARASVQENQRIWGFIERHSLDNVITGPVEDAIDSLGESVSAISISNGSNNTAYNSRYAALDNHAYWDISPSLFESFLHLSKCFAHNGQLPEAQYYLAQCQAIAEAVHSPSMTHACLMLQGQYAVCKGFTEEGLAILQELEQSVPRLPVGLKKISARTLMALNYIKIGRIDTGIAACNEAMHQLRGLTNKSALDRLVYQPEIEGLTSQLSDIKLDEPKPIPARKSRIAPKRAQTKSRVKPGVIAVSTVEELQATDIIPLNVLRSEILRVSALANLGKGALDTATSHLEDANAFPHREQSMTLQTILSSQINLRQALQQLIGDPVFSILPESSICCPAINAQDLSNSTTKSPPKASRSAKAAPSKVLNKHAGLRDKMTVEKHAQDLSVARRCLSENLDTAMTSHSTFNIHTIVGTLGKILTMLCALPGTQAKGFGSSRYMAYILELGRRVAIDRELRSIGIECQLSQRRELDCLPDYKARESGNEYQQDQSFHFSDFQEDYINIIPKSWQVLSLTLSESHEEIWISKLRPGQSPFILRLPFNRENTSEGDIEVFNFSEGKSEMSEIVKMANTSAHNGRDMSGKGAKAAWWDNRASLDTRLKDLLTNIESIWFGGFRGIFSPSVPEPHLLARFQQSLQNILDKHLPSRQTPGKPKKPDPIILDPRVLELFVGLGPPSEGNDIDEQLMDLLYFIVDILQFNKERNAYDEIDFDAIVVEAVDALRQYHQAATTSEPDGGMKHTILILDRHLHGFPWESLPCMTGHSISRLPSLGCLRSRVLQMQKGQEGKSNQQELDGIQVNPDHGAYVLNPGGDLVNTQAVFENSLQRLSNWESFVEREPSEADMKKCLQDNKLFLYFGHGSGRQYMRPRTIKKLEQCAVALLMGCSSGALTEAGDYEAYGTPIDYMHAGCPALLATLWDVTDKDIDRFSNEVLQRWGLFRERVPLRTSSPMKKSTKQKGKMKEGEEVVAENKATAVSLDEAVSMSRDSCFLRYLNGAAPVVYGVPVYLS